MTTENKKDLLEAKLRQNERIYRDACSLFRGEPHVFRYYDQTDEISIDLLTVENSPIPGTVSFSSLGLMHYPGGQRRGGKPLRIEIAAACRAEYEYVPNLLSACCFDIMNARFSCQHGSVYRDCVNTYIQGSPMKHLLFAAASIYWNASFPDLDFDDKSVIWMTALPISENELSYLEQNGADALIDQLIRNSADLFCWARPSVL